MKKLLLSAFAMVSSLGFTAQAQSLPITFDFNSGMPSGWYNVTLSPDGGFLAGSNTALSSDYFVIPSTGSNIVATNDDGCNSCNKSAEYLITSTIDLSGVSLAHAKFDSYYLDQAYNGAQETAEFLYSTDGGTTWNTIGSIVGDLNGWKTQYYDISAACGNSSVVFAFFYGDGGGWNYGLAIEDFEIFAPTAYDAAIEGFVMDPIVDINDAPWTIDGEVVNYGGVTLTDFVINYTVNGGTPVTETVSNVNIAPYSSYAFSHSTSWTPSTPGYYDIEVYATGLNFTSDNNNANDTAAVSIQVAPNSAERVVLAEEFTSSTCAPCASFNPGYNTLLTTNNVNAAGSYLTSIKYQMNWPSPGNDPAYNGEGAARRSYYGVNGVPDVFYSGFAVPTSASQANLDIVQGFAAFAEIDAEWSATGTYIQCDVTVDALADLNGANSLRIAMVEKEITHNIQTNGETEFFQIFRQFMDGPNGVSVGAMSAGDTYTHYANKIITTNAAPAQNSYDFWVGASNMDVIVFLQDDNTGEVLQAALATYTTSSVEEMDNFARMIKVYPNPANDMAGVEIDLIEGADVIVNVVNTVGQTVYTASEAMAAGTQKLNINTADMSAGLYFVNVTVNGTSETLRLNIAH